MNKNDCNTVSTGSLKIGILLKWSWIYHKYYTSSENQTVKKKKEKEHQTIWGLSTQETFSTFYLFM